MRTSEADVDAAVEILRAGGVIGLPTETVYGLAADASSDAAVEEIFRIKGRPSGHPLIVHLAGVESRTGWVARWPAEADALSALWPGPITLVVPAGPQVSRVVTGGRDTVAIRVPDHPVALAVLERFGGGLAAPSANRFGRVSPTTADDVRDDLHDAVPLVLDGGPSEVGLESTIVSLIGEPRLLRPGGVPVELVEELLGRAVPVADAEDRSAPGTLPSHYAPRAKVELVAEQAVVTRAIAHRDRGRTVAVLVGEGGEAPDGVHVLRSPDDPRERARLLYRRLREADAAGAEVMVTSLPAEAGLGRAVADRLRRAAHRD